MVMIKLIAILVATSTTFLTLNSSAATSEVKWTNPEDYRDIHPGEGHRAKFKAKVFADFEKHFAILAENLPENQKLMIEVKDVDLAGDVNQNFRRIRVVKDIFFPRMKFSYQVIDLNKNEISSGEVDLKDMNFLMGSSLRYKSDRFSYEKRMLDNWFKETFLK